MENKRLAGRGAVVTGAARGIGEAIARRLPAEGAALVVADIDADLAETVADSLGPLLRRLERSTLPAMPRSMRSQRSSTSNSAIATFS